MLQPKYTNEFLKCLKRDKKRGLDMRLINVVMNNLVNQQPLAPKHRDHALTGGYKGFRECHILPDWLLVYYITDNTIVFTKTGTHADLFN